MYGEGRVILYVIIYFHQFFRVRKEGILLIFVHGIKSPNQSLQRMLFQSLVHQYCKTRMKMVRNLWPQSNTVNHLFCDDYLSIAVLGIFIVAQRIKHSKIMLAIVC